MTHPSPPALLRLYENYRFLKCIQFSVWSSNLPLPTLLLPNSSFIYQLEMITEKFVKTMLKVLLKKAADLFHYFALKKHLNRHVQHVHEKQNIVSCKICSKTFSSNYILNGHLANEHSETVHEESISLLLCSNCGMKFGRSDQLKRHINSVHEEKWAF